MTIEELNTLRERALRRYEEAKEDMKNCEDKLETAKAQLATAEGRKIGWYDQIMFLEDKLREKNQEPFKRKCTVAEARELIPKLIRDGKFGEVWWITGKHNQDNDYVVGWAVTADSAGDWTDHPNYSGASDQARPDDTSPVDFVLGWLPGPHQNIDVVTVCTKEEVT